MDLTLESKNSITLTQENRITSPSIEEMDVEFEDVDESFESQGTVFNLESKNNINLTLESKI